jgi:aryl-alcohol dehydrogenase-like predicted oxidoreductase
MTKMRKLGNGGPAITALGLGCMSFSHTYGPAEEAESLATIERALELGCNFLDTADIYGAGHNEQLVGKAMRGRREQIVLATKCGFVPGSEGNIASFDGSPKHIREACEASLKRLGIDVIDLYYLHRVDPQVPIEDSVGAMAELVRQGKVRHIGLSEASPNTVRRASKVHPLSALQSEYSLWTRDPEQGALQTCRELGMCFVAFSPVGRGFLTGKLTRNEFAKNDFRRNVPRFEGENFERNLDLVEKIKAIAARKRCTPAQLALAWVLAQAEHIVAIPGTRRRDHWEENWGALQVELRPEDLREIREQLPESAIAGERYNQEQMARVDRS